MSAPAGDAFHERADLFHNHLDACARCARNVFDLCDEGARLLKSAAEHGEKMRGVCDCGKQWADSATNPDGHAVDCPAHPQFKGVRVTQGMAP